MSLGDKIIRRIQHAVRFGKIMLVDDSGVAQKAQIDVGPKDSDGKSQGLRDNTFVISTFGEASNPPVGSDAILLSVVGDLGNGLIIGHNHQASRLTGLEPGDKAIYDVRGAFILLKSTGIVIHAAPGLDVTVENAKDVNVTCTGTATLTAPHVIIDSDDIQLGAAGGEAVARVGDSVVGGVITSGSAKVKAA